jgi:hypothetical protein
MRCEGRIYLGQINLVQGLDGGGDVALVGAQVHDEGECVVVLDLLHGRLRAQRVLDDLVLVKLVAVREALALVLGVALQHQGLGPAEVDRGINLGLALGDDTLGRGLGGGLGLGDRSLVRASLLRHLRMHRNGEFPLNGKMCLSTSPIQARHHMA